MAPTRPHGERIATLEAQMLELNRCCAELERYVQGPSTGSFKSVRSRLHDLEESARVAVALAQESARLSDERYTSRARSWGGREKIFAAAVTLVIAATPYVLLFTGHG